MGLLSMLFMLFIQFQYIHRECMDEHLYTPHGRNRNAVVWGFSEGDQIGLRIWRAGKVEGRCINHVMVCFFATLGDVATMRSRVGEITHSLLLFNALTQMKKKTRLFSQNLLTGAEFAVLAPRSLKL